MARHSEGRYIRRTLIEKKLDLRHADATVEHVLHRYHFRPRFGFSTKPKTDGSILFIDAPQHLHTD